MADQEQKLFAPVSLSVIGDRRLTGSHWRVYAAIAAHDGLGVNGQPCWIGHQRLSSEASVDYTNLSKLIGDLERWGYVLRARHPFDRRKRAYSLNYKNKKVVVGGSTNYPSRQASRDEILGRFTNDQAEIVGGQNPQAIENIDPARVQYITRSVREKEKPPLADSESLRRSRARLEGALAAGDDDSAVETEKRNARARENKKQEEADASFLKEERDLAEALAFRKKWQKWLCKKYRFATRAAVVRVGIWEQAANGDYGLLERVLTDADRADIPDGTGALAFVGERLGIPYSPW